MRVSASAPLALRAGEALGAIGIQRRHDNDHVERGVIVFGDEEGGRPFKGNGG